MTTELHVKRVGEGVAVILLHGLFGSGSNLGVVARALQAQYAVYSVDLPSHGRSAWLADPTVPGMVARVLCWMDAQGIAQAHFLGHSLGGKVAMELALQQPERVLSLVVADIAPVRYAGSHDAVFAALDAVATSPCHSRQEAAERMSAFLEEDSVIQFLLSSLERDKEGGYRWRFDVAGLRAGYASLLDAPAAGRRYEGPVLFIKGSESDYLQEQYWPAVRTLFPVATVKVMDGCGHWLHAQKPALFTSIVSRFLASLEHSKLGATDNSEEER
tara:strand:- start:5345 stop:6163 length:819 start_codon:yes stop_codon:yes gene_type:complete